MILLAALLALSPAQDDLEARLDRLAETLEAGGASATLAGLLRDEHGRQAIFERIESIVATRTARLDRDPQSAYEDWLFARDERGAFRLRPERKRDWNILNVQTRKAPERTAPFFKRCDAFVARIQGDGEMEKRARAGWSNPEFRAAYFNLRANELQERSATDHLNEAIDHVAELKARLEEMAPLTGSYFKQAALVKDDAVRSRLVTETGVVAVLGRVLRQAAEGSEKVLGAVSVNDDGQQTVSFNLPLAELAPFLNDIEAILKDLALPLGIEKPPARVLLAERVLAFLEGQKEVADNVFAEIIEDGFEANGDTLRVKKGRYVDGDMNESPDALESEYRSTIDVFRGSRTAFDQLAELCADPAEAAPFSNLPATFIVQEDQARVVEELSAAVRAKGFDLFADLYLEKKGERWAARPERAGRIEDLVRRAAEIRKENQ